VNGFTFDYSGHLLHIKNEYTESLVKKLLGSNISSIKRSSWIYSSGVYTRYPFQSNLFGLPPDVIKECLMGFIKSAYERQNMRVESFEDWILKYLGEGIADRFMIPYNKKLWTVPPREMTTEWLGKYVPKPNIDEILDGALRSNKQDWGYNSYFYYPKRGGIESLINGFLSHIEPDSIHLKKKVVRISLEKKTIFYDDGDCEQYEKLISTMPLNELVSIILEIPSDLRNVAGKLRYNSVLNINLGIGRGDISDKHWIYFPEDDYVFNRVGFASNFSNSMAPAGCSSIYTEICFSDWAPLQFGSIEEAKKRVCKDLMKCSIIDPRDKIVCSHSFSIKPAYVIYDKEWNRARSMILDYLKERGIFSIGRYGAWEYSAMEDAILEGKAASEEINRM